jgi:hypothetical protein
MVVLAGFPLIGLFFVIRVAVVVAEGAESALEHIASRLGALPNPRLHIETEVNAEVDARVLHVVDNVAQILIVKRDARRRVRTDQGEGVTAPAEEALQDVRRRTRPDGMAGRIRGMGGRRQQRVPGRV